MLVCFGNLDATNASSYEVGRTGLTSAAPPTRSSVAVEGHAYYFGGSAWLDTPVLPLAPLESPQLTMGAWVYPQSRFEAHDGVRWRRGHITSTGKSCCRKGQGSWALASA